MGQPTIISTMTEESIRLVRPDKTAIDAKLGSLQEQIDNINKDLAIIEKSIAVPNRNGDNNKSLNTKRNEIPVLRKKVKTLVAKQDKLKANRETVYGEIKLLEAEIKRKNAEIESRLPKNDFGLSTVKQFDIELKKINDEIKNKDGHRTLVQERELELKKIRLNSTRKIFVSIKPLQEQVSNDEEKLSKLKKQLTGFVTIKSIQSEIDSTLEKINEVRNESENLQSTISSSKQSLITKRNLLYVKRDEIYNQFSNLRREFDKEVREFEIQNEQESYERFKAVGLRSLSKDRQTTIAELQKKLVEAQIPAFFDKINDIQTCLSSLDPEYVKPVKNPIFTSSKIDGSEQNMPSVINDDLLPMESVYEAEHYSTAPSKNKKLQKIQLKKAAADSSTPQELSDNSKFTLDPSLITTLAQLSVTIPINTSGVEKTVTELHKLLNEVTEQEASVTASAVKKAEMEIEKATTEFDRRKKNLEDLTFKQYQNRNNNRNSKGNSNSNANRNSNRNSNRKSN